MTAAARTLPPFLARLESRDRLALGGGALAVLGGLILLAVDGMNANGAPGPTLVVVIGAAIAIAARLLGRGRRDLVTALVAGVLLVAIVEAIPPIRYSADLDAFGGVVGAIARGAVLAGSIGLLVGVGGRPDATRILALDSPLGRIPILLLVAGAALLTVGWLALVSIGVGFAPRVIDGLALVAASLAVAAARGPVSAAGPALLALGLRFAPIVLAGGVALVTLGSILAIGDGFDDLLASGVASVAAYAIYAASAIPFIAAVVLVTMPLVRSVRKR